VELFTEHEKKVEEVAPAPVADMRCVNRECRLFGIKLEPDEVDLLHEDDENVKTQVGCALCHLELRIWIEPT